LLLTDDPVSVEIKSSGVCVFLQSNWNNQDFRLFKIKKIEFQRGSTQLDPFASALLLSSSIVTFQPGPIVGPYVLLGIPFVKNKNEDAKNCLYSHEKVNKASVFALH